MKISKIEEEYLRQTGENISLKELQEKLNKNVDVITEETYLDETVEENKYGKLETWIRPTRGLCQRKSVRLYKGTGCR